MSRKKNIGALERLLELIKFLFGICCAVVLGIMAWSVYDDFSSEPTGTSIQTVSETPLPFPAISICDPNYDREEAYRVFQ